MNGGLVRLREILNAITPSERKVADFILQDPQRIVGMSVAQLSQESGGSQAAVIRLCKSAGFKGYQELMLKVLGDLQEERSGIGSGGGYQEFIRGDSIERIIENVSNNNIQSIRDTLKIMTPAHIEKAVDALLRAKRIYFYGIGASNLIAVDAQQKFIRINKTSFSFTDSDLQIITAVMLERDDVAVGISYSGETQEIVECMKRARELGATTISITRYGNSTVSQLADIPLYISSTETEIRSGATSSRITQLNMIDILYLGVASREYDKSVRYLEISRSAVKKKK
ncbi:MurR/RpiR family transcriptional regulator [Paenibacillus eucommiae]|uniref:DNA-binding MurR/RpiR family transcriptional regulator n=1 Tax=Paenibacillus eucommiae TaxID=1355755 RepID=A0ABS4IZZ1_9BACL|nr:MurR/RpiR family transcriptional regulator [Paenibacillus eucommiae]MBP1993152.1 DNA-binding MurR/RpiR family transcriptional regulator [Paenibacillus eucommiae]